MISAAFVVPTWHYFLNPFKLQPLNELYLATVVDSHFQGNGVSMSVVDLRSTRFSGQGKGESTIDPAAIPEHDFYFYWITKSADYNEIVLVMESLRKVRPRAKHAAGGTHVDNFPKQCAAQFDAIVLGPGEESFVEILNDFAHKRTKKVYASSWDKAQYDNYPIARRDYLPRKAIVNTELFEKYGKVPGTSAMFSRGCCFKCAYCVYNVPSVIQMRSAKTVAAEIASLKNAYKIAGVNLRDEICIPLSKRAAVAQMEAIGQADVLWRGQTRVGVGRELLKLARDTGCVELALGVESVSQKVLDIVNKKQTLKQIRDTIENCKTLGIRTKMCLILGLPGEPRNIVAMTRKFIEQTRPDFVNISGFCPVPGSGVFKDPAHFGIKRIDRDWSKHAHLLFRFSDKEHFGLPFEYEPVNRWGQAFSRQEIVKNIQELQHYCQQREMSY